MIRIETIEQLTDLIPYPGETAAAKIRDHICEQGIAFTRRSSFVVMATRGSWGIEVSSKGDHAGFIEIVDSRTILIPERKGNRLALGLRNILADPQVGLMLVRPNTDEVLRISGRAELLHDEETCARLSYEGQPAVLIIKVSVDRAAFHCVRAAKRAGLWDPASWDEKTHISFGKIYADATGKPEIEDYINHHTEISNNDL